MNSGSADRNLLFGILAMQMDFISREGLITATTVWIRDKSKPLDQILLEQGLLRQDEYQLTTALVDKHLEKHGHDVEKSLAAISSLGPDICVDLGRLADPDVDASLLQVTVAHVSEDRHATQSITIGEPTAAGKRFRVLRPHAQGGLGQVSVALDEELHREVALKEIQPQHADQPTSRERFVKEAEVTGALEHPGIVPVYGLGQYADGRPFYAMRFIRGDSLKEAIGRFHGVHSATRDLGERSLELRQLLRRFIDVCNAIEFAHSRGVLHRDLKPGNIMLGRYGETLVVAWGLAKLIDRPGGHQASSEPVVTVSSGSAAGETMQGLAIGTPAYMSPEQAAGRLDLLGPASDVYSLGATLYSILTGRSPFDPRDSEILRKVQNGAFAAPRDVVPQVPKALEAVCLKAMAKEPGGRYETPLALARDVERFLGDEPVSAVCEPLTARLARWARRHRAAVLSAVAALAVATVGLVIATVLIMAKDQFAFCNWLSQKNGIPEDQWCYLPDKDGRYTNETRTRPNHLKLAGFRLPTKPEWQYACRCGTTTDFSFGDDKLFAPKYIDLKIPAMGIKPAFRVGSRLPNPWGLFDMHGGEEEPVSVLWGYYNILWLDRVDETLLSASGLAGMGGSWNSALEDMTSNSSRDLEGAKALSGFRVARTVTPGTVDISKIWSTIFGSVQ